jgi:hypothetical protein
LEFHLSLTLYPQMNLNDLKLCQFAAWTCHAQNVNQVGRVPRRGCRWTRKDPVLAMNRRKLAEFGAWENRSDNEQSLVATSVMEASRKCL